MNIEDEKLDIVLGHHYHEISDVLKCVFIGIIVIAIVITVLCVLI